MDKYYNHKTIEKKWQDLWLEKGVFRAEDNADAKKYYALDMFPYPSGAGLHVGHPEGYTATDIISRYKRMQGYNVLHPMGWDAFGLPAENYAIKAGVAPAESTTTNVNTFRKQIQSLGFSYDWDREVDTSSPEYYKWTQWIFLKLYEKGLAYKKKAHVNWCETCQTVLANEQVIDGKCERSGDDVIQKELEQWFFKITDYADQLLDDLEGLDWPEPIKLMQKNWIGKSEGAELEFKIQNSEFKIKVFTTRPDTLYGATYMVVAPEHELIASMQGSIENYDEVEKYIVAAGKKTDLQRTDLNKDKTGVELKGIKAVNPATNEDIPVYVADYVLSTYGTGAIMAVPAHDERDYDFAKKYGLEIRQVVDGGDIDESAYTGPGTIINSGEFEGMAVEEAKVAITKKVNGELKTQYRLRDWLVSRQRYWGAPIPIVYDPEGNPHPVKEEYLPLILPTDVEYKPKGTSPLGSSEAYAKLAEELYGEGWRFEIDTMDTFVDSSWYFLRFCDAQNNNQAFDSKKVVYWMPADLYVGGAEHAVLHLLYARFFTKVFRDMGLLTFDEPFTKLRNQGMILAEDGRKMSKSLGNVVNPDDVVDEYGADTMRLYEMFMGPLEDAKPWSTKSIIGVRRFLEKVWLVTAEWLENDMPSDTSDELDRLLHKTVKKVTDDIENMKCNTAISAMMIMVNQMAKEKSFSKNLLMTFLQLLSPFAPHVAAELWEQVQGSGLVSQTEWPTYDESKLREESVTIAVQVNGKVRAEITAAADSDEETVVALAKENEQVQKYLSEGEVRKTIYVPGRLLNIVVS
ncbi:MAG: leucine--tRNA ligase [Patescibacteria group bacterium]